jgi:hypothetical protein
MRTLLKVTIDVVSGNKAIRDGSLQKIVQSTSERLKPETSFFYPDNGKRTCIMVFDMKDSFEIPGIVEPFFMGLNAEVELYPVMNAADLQKGLETWMKSEKN